VSEKMTQLLQKAGYEIVYPENFNHLCCGMAFLSKGFKEAGLKKVNELEKALQKASNDGVYPILCDMSPCLFTMKENLSQDLKMYEPVEFILEYLLAELDLNPIDEPISVFEVCSMKKMGLEKKLIELASMCSTHVVIPETNCCGFAGDRGFTYPELNKHGLRYLKEQLPQEIKKGYSTSRTCEIGLSNHSGINHKSIIYLVDQVTNKKSMI
jgi:D-lactate dehydrogenase